VRAIQVERRRKLLPGSLHSICECRREEFYMQQRYYDPVIGRFLSTDPEPVNGLGTNFNRYNYAGNNPYKYVDPDGRVITLANPNDASAISSMINSRAKGKFGFDDSGNLKITSKKGSGSAYYQERLNAAIKSDSVIIIDISNLVETEAGTEDLDLTSGGGITGGPDDDFSMTQVVVSVNAQSGLLYTDGKALRDDPADVLAHELAGHAIPHAVGSDTGNAVHNENKVQKENGNPLSKKEPEHEEVKR
jgi:RHS repeat-associated protein